MIGKLVKGFTIFGYPHSISIRKSPTIIMNPFHEGITKTLAATEAKVITIFAINLIAIIQNK